MKDMCQVDDALLYIRQGKIIAYPTEAVYGLGCDPFNQQAVKDLLALKQRPESNGFILLIANWSQLTPLISGISEHQLHAVRQTWPGPVTWVFPKASGIPAWLTGSQHGIAIRMSAHPVAHALCANGPVISTSANIHGQLPAKNINALRAQFPTGLDAVVKGELGQMAGPCGIYDACTGACLRKPV